MDASEGDLEWASFPRTCRAQQMTCSTLENISQTKLYYHSDRTTRSVQQNETAFLPAHCAVKKKTKKQNTFHIDFDPHWHDGIAPLLQICLRYIHGANLPFQQRSGDFGGYQSTVNSSSYTGHPLRWVFALFIQSFSCHIQNCSIKTDRVQQQLDICVYNTCQSASLQYHGAFTSLETWQFCTEHKSEWSVRVCGVKFNGSASTALCEHTLYRCTDMWS